MDKQMIKRIKWDLETLKSYYLNDTAYNIDDRKRLAEDVSKLISYLEYEEEYADD